MKTVLLFLIATVGIISISGCSRDQSLQVPEMTAYTLDIPPGFPQPEIPGDNQLTENRVKLGKMLFFDKTLSLDSTISCGSCHFQEFAFADPRRLSLGVNDSLSIRNSMPLFNLAYAQSLFWDGGVPTLELQVLAPIEDHREMNLALTEAVKRIQANPQYVKWFQKAYNREPDLYGLVRAIAAFERTMISGNSRYDQYAFQGKTSALNDTELRGMGIFFGETAECFHCHTGFNFSDQSFQNNGLYSEYADQGRARVTSRTSDIGRFKVPSLRNIEKTAPYMHDGSLSSLEAVIDHYMSGGKGHPNQSPLVRPFTLTSQEKSDLIAFLKSLTDESFLRNPKFRDG
jgi:cytochrome c peroxidase